MELFALIWWEAAARPLGDDHVTNNRNRKLIDETSSNEHREQKCCVLWEYKTYLKHIWYRLNHQTLSMVDGDKFT